MNKKITELAEMTIAPQLNDALPIVDVGSSTTKKIRYQTLRDAISNSITVDTMPGFTFEFELIDDDLSPAVGVVGRSAFGSPSHKLYFNGVDANGNDITNFVDNLEGGYVIIRQTNSNIVTGEIYRIYNITTISGAIVVLADQLLTLDDGAAGDGQDVEITFTASIQAIQDSQLNGFMFTDPLTGSAQTFGASFTDLTRTFYMGQTGGISPAHYYSNGKKFEFPEPSTIVIGDVEGLHYIYFDEDGVLQETTTWDDDIILKYAIVAIVYWDATNSKHIYLGHEYLHGIKMGSMTHAYLHETVGFRLATGGGLSNFTIGNGDWDSHAQFSVDETVAWDEDAKFEFSTKIANSLWDVYYRSGASDWRHSKASNFPLSISVSVNYNTMTGPSWGLTGVTNGDYVLAHIATINDLDRPFIAIVGQATYGNLPAARAGAETEAASLMLQGLPTAEMRLVGTVIFQCNTSYANASKARIVQTGDGGDYIDWRNQIIGKAVTGLPLHASTHITGGGDTIANATSSAAGLLPVLSNNATDFLNGQGAWAVPAGGVPAAHAASHATAGGDPVLPGSIGAEPAFAKLTAFNKNFGAASGTVCQGNDSRLSDARTPTAHAASHITGGGDTIANATALAAGLLPVLSNVATQFLNGQGAWAVPAGGGAWVGVQVLYVGKHGNDANAGTSPADAKLTISSAITAAASGGPFRIEVLDGGTYTENLVFTSTDDEIFLHAPAAHLSGYIRLEADDVYIVLGKHTGSAAYNSSAIYVTGAYKNRGIDIKEGVYSATTTHVLRDVSSTGGIISFKCQAMTVTGTGSLTCVFYGDSQGAIHADVEYIDTQRQITFRDNIVGIDNFNFGKIDINSSFTLGGTVFQWGSDGTYIWADYVNLNSRAYLLMTVPSKILEGGFGQLANYSTSYPIPITYDEIWGLKNIEKVQVEPYYSANVTALGTFTYRTSSSDSDRVYYQFHIPFESIAQSIINSFIPNNNQTSKNLSLDTDFAQQDEYYYNHSLVNINYGIAGAMTALKVYYAEISGFFTGLAAGDFVNLGIGKANGAAAGVYYMREVTLRCFMC